ncbi:RND superfamily putative drug exporter [Microbacterium sp. 1154]|uniref:MMPL family transporter n=1 Tax=Microbacterium sp. 1154 TaxID=2817733 RepID=UPI00285BCD85|nr:MMPL family transporter [Microbacterium sp. 1154]MDR6689180.1 RND superfamily putative drug exporter [Microbacterium sp. 1154]
MLYSLGRRVSRHRLFVLLVWAVLVVGGGALAGDVFDRTVSVADAPAGSESLRASERLDALDPEGEIVTAVLRGEDFFSPTLRDSATAAMSSIRALPGVAEVSDAYTSGGAIGDDGRSSLVVVELARGLSGDEAVATASAVSDLLHGIDAPEELVGGPLLAEEAFVERATTDAALGEGVAILVLVVLLTLALGSLRIAMIPVVTALAAIAPTLAALGLLARVVDVNEFAVNVVTILGLGLAVDYSLLVVLRLREERTADPTVPLDELIARTVAGAGRAVLVSGLAVTVALVGILVLGDPLLSGMALGGAVVVVISTLAGLTLVPASLSFLHRALPSAGVRTWARPWAGRVAREGVLARSTRIAQRGPGVVAVVAAALMLLLAAPAASLALDDSDIRSLPAAAEERRAYEATTTGFTGFGIEPVTVVLDGSVQDAAVTGVLDRIAALPEVADADVVQGLPPEITAVAFTPTGDSATGAAAQSLVHAVRGLDSPVPLAVTGPAASLIDTREHLASRLPGALAIVAAASFALLFALTRSVIVPVKALVLAGLTVASTLGVLTAVFGWGWGAPLLGFEPTGTLDVTTPLLIGLLAFGLTMDYEVFLLARITEHWRARDLFADPRSANAEAVRHGIARTGPVVTLAAVAICIVFLGFAFGELVAMKEIGVGMVVAVILDVTVVRGLLLPALMTLLGRANWWPGAGSAPFASPAPLRSLETASR